MTIELVDFPMIFHSYVSLPESNICFLNYLFFVDLQWDVFIHITNPHNMRALWKNVELGYLLLQTGAYIYNSLIVESYIHIHMMYVFLYRDKIYINEYGYNLYIYMCIHTRFFQASRTRIGEACIAPRALVVSPSGWTVPFGDPWWKIELGSHWVSGNSRNP